MNNLPYKIVNFTQGDSDWLQWRRSKITASQAGVIMGLSPWQTPLQLYNQILSGEEIADNDAMKNGRESEPEARGWLSHQTSTAYVPVCMESVEYPWMACSLDAWNQYGNVQLAEIKCGEKSHRMAEMGDISPLYFAQMQLQMCVSGAEKCYYVSYQRSQQDGIIITVKRDELFIEKMIPLLKTFYNRLHSFDPPDPIDGRDVFVLDDPDAILEAESYMLACNDVEQAEMKKERIRKALIERASGRSVRIGHLKVSKVVRPGNIDYKAIKELQGLDLTAYRKKSIESWRFS